jgi:hypothetical protein
VLCYVRDERGTERTAVGPCRSGSAGLRLEHLRETAAHLSDNVLAGCHDYTWASAATARAAATDRPALHRARPRLTYWVAERLAGA